MNNKTKIINDEKLSALPCCDDPCLDIWWRRVECLHCKKKGAKASTNTARVALWDKMIEKENKEK